MTLLDTLKSLLGLGSTDARSDSRGETGVTVEREASGAPEPVSSPDEPDETDASAGTADGAATAEDTHDEDSEGEDADEDPAAEEADDEDPAAEEADDEDPAAGADEPTDVLEGIGPAYAGRLSDAGVETVADLAAADLDSLAEEADVPEGRLETWIDRAESR